MICPRCKQPLPEGPDRGVDLFVIPPPVPAGCCPDPDRPERIVHRRCVTRHEFEELDPREQRVALAESEDGVDDLFNDPFEELGPA